MVVSISSATASDKAKSLNGNIIHSSTSYTALTGILYAQRRIESKFRSSVGATSKDCPDPDEGHKV